ncbi:MAG: ribonuclease P protein component [Clostridia bacterium]|nr:ribonuclease P protein component [Clostridia bacterium]MDR3645132.1 ribonuclease P protein component [Clostridia bacterium]
MHTTIPLKENRDFRRIYSRGRSFVSRGVVVYVTANRLSKNRLGITVSKKLGGAVQRNRAKRIIREAYRLTEPAVAVGYDFVLVARSRTLAMKMGELQKEMRGVLKNAGVLLR